MLQACKLAVTLAEGRPPVLRPLCLKPSIGSKTKLQFSGNESIWRGLSLAAFKGCWPFESFCVYVALQLLLVVNAGFW